MPELQSKHIDLNSISDGLELIIDERTANSLFDCEDASLKGEVRYQITEGCFYDYEFTDPAFYFSKTDFLQPNIRKPYMGIISPNIYVGTLTLQVFNSERPDWSGSVRLEVRSVKSDYRTDYRHMLESITEKCTELIMQIDSPVTQRFVTNYDADSRTLYQRFSFVKSIVDSQETEEAIQMVITNSTTRWETETEERDIRNIRKYRQKDIQQLASRNNRMSLPASHFLSGEYGIRSVPTRIESVRKAESKDTPENRFIKYVLQEFLFFCESCSEKFEQYSRSRLEAKALSDKLTKILNHSFFKEISRPDSLKLNSPVLQRKSGYREMLNAWLKYDLAARLIWEGGNDVYETGKKDIATLYEYWLFFTLLDLLREVFNIEPKNIHELIVFEKDRLALNLKQGRTIALKGEYVTPGRKLNIEFSYNKSFGGGKEYPDAGSWTTTLRPDYTLSVWPTDLSHVEAELKELITHIHFDAKYKVNNFYELVDTGNNTEELDNIKKEEKKGNFKNADLLKMHAYKDAIRRTSGAYVLYPGEGKTKPFRGFHEIIPGLGAFVLKPDNDETGKEDLKKFILKVVTHFLDRASQREHTAVKVYDIHKKARKDTETLKSPMPEYSDDGEKLIPDETYVLVGYSRSKERFEWYEKNGKYNFRMDDDAGSLILETSVANARYLLLRKQGEETSENIYRITSKGPKVYSKNQLEKMGYPVIGNLKDYYLVIDIEKVDSTLFGNSVWNFKELVAYKKIKENNKSIYKSPGIPFVVSLTELMQVAESK